jgi:hypothetical protein
MRLKSIWNYHSEWPSEHAWSCFAFPEKRPRIMPNPLSTIVWLWSLASERPRMFYPYHARSFKNMDHPHLPPWEHQKQPPKRPLMNTLQEPTGPCNAFLTMWTVSSTANNRTGKEVKNAFYLWPAEYPQAVYYKLQLINSSQSKGRKKTCNNEQ